MGARPSPSNIRVLTEADWRLDVFLCRNADALRELSAEDGTTRTYFVEPLNEEMPLRDFLRRLEGLPPIRFSLCLQRLTSALVVAQSRPNPRGPRIRPRRCFTCSHRTATFTRHTGTNQSMPPSRLTYRQRCRGQAKLWVRWCARVWARSVCSALTSSSLPADRQVKSQTPSTFGSGAHVLGRASTRIRTRTSTRLSPAQRLSLSFRRSRASCSAQNSGHMQPGPARALPVAQNRTSPSRPPRQQPIRCHGLALTQRRLLLHLRRRTTGRT